MALRTRGPAGQPLWPMCLIVGQHGAGKTYKLIEASYSSLVSRTLLITLGEIEPDQYAGAPVEFVEHDGTYGSVYLAVRDAVAEPQDDDEPTLIGFDSVSVLWDLCIRDTQVFLNEQARLHAQARRLTVPIGDVEFGNLGWDMAREKWRAIIDPLRTRRGPVILTARYADTEKKGRQIKAEGNLPYEVSTVLESETPGVFTMTKTNTPGLHLTEPRVWPEFTFDLLWREMGLHTGTAGTPDYKPLRVAAPTH